MTDSAILDCIDRAMHNHAGDPVTSLALSNLRDEIRNLLQSQEQRGGGESPETLCDWLLSDLSDRSGFDLDIDDETREEWRAEWVARINEFQRNALRAPEGWVCVPREPTEEMLKAVWLVMDTDIFGGKSALPSDIYKAMIAAAPNATRAKGE